MYSLLMYDSNFIGIFIVMGGLIVILVKFGIMLRQLFFKSDPSRLRVGVCPSFFKRKAFGLLESIIAHAIISKKKATICL
jgi:hypothetical protein